MIEASLLSSLTDAEICSKSNEPFGSVATNSKDVRTGDLFVALRGARDGHLFVNDAIRAGAQAVVVSERVTVPDDVTVVTVPDTLTALQELAAAVRRRSGVDALAITGSVGKTTTKNMIAHVLADEYSVLSSPKSYNNHIGVPLTLLSLDDTHSDLISEIGTNHPGEIANLVDIVQPRAALVTQIGYAHLGNFESREALADEKASIFKGVLDGGVWFVNVDDSLLLAAIERIERPASTKVVFFGSSPDADVRVSDVAVSARGTTGTVRFGDEHESFFVPLVGKHFASTVAATLAVATERRMDLHGAIARLASFPGTDGRASVSSMNDDKLLMIDDTYNGSPDSVLAALDTLATFTGRRRIAALGEMRELGQWTTSLHELVGAKASSCADELVFIGPSGPVVRDAAVASGMPEGNIHVAASALESAVLIEQLVAETPGQAVAILAKGARFVHAERIPLFLSGVSVSCALEQCSLYIRCSDCPQLTGALT